MVTNSGDLLGYVLGGCKLERLIGQGGMSAVYLARQLQPERYVAVKVLMPHLDVSSEDYATFLARFRREANIVAKLEHINIVPLHAYGEERHLAYLVMPYIGGGSLSDIINAQGKLSLQQTFHYLQQAAAALDYAHRHNVIHRDLKPGNFLLYPNDNRLVLADFGVARIVDEFPLGGYEAALTETGVMPGTLAYMAPEMLQDARSVDHRVDIYALGIVLYQMLSGQLPFTGDLVALINKQLEEALPPLHQRDPVIPTSIDSVLRKATAKQRQERYSSAGQLANDFLLALSGKATHPGIGKGVEGKNDDINATEKMAAIGKIGAKEAMETTGEARNFTEIPSKSPLYPGTPVDTLIVDKRTMTPPPLRQHSHGGTAPGNTDPQFIGASSGDPRPRKWSRKIWLLLAASLAIVCLLAGGLWMLYRNNETSTVTTQGQQVVQQYYTDLNNHDYQDAYNLLAPEYQNHVSYDLFVQNYTNAVHIDFTVDDVNEVDVNNVNVVVTVHALRALPRGGDVTTIARVAYRVIHRNGAWKILLMRRLVQT